MPNEDLIGGLKQKLGEFVKDLSSLDVVTLSGNITAEIKGIDDQAEGGLGKQLSKVIKGAIAKGAEGKISCVAYTHSDFDGDCILYINHDSSPELIKLHQQAVESAQEARARLIEAAGSLVGL